MPKRHFLHPQAWRHEVSRLPVAVRPLNKPSGSLMGGAFSTEEPVLPDDHMALTTCDDRRFVVPNHIAMRSKTLRELLAGKSTSPQNTLNGVKGDVLSIVLQWLQFEQGMRDAQ